MVEIGENYRGKDQEIKDGANWCVACDVEKETTEHVIDCKEYKRITGHTIQTHKNCFENTEWLRKAIHAYEMIEETRKILVKAKRKR